MSLTLTQVSKDRSLIPLTSRHSPGSLTRLHQVGVTKVLGVPGDFNLTALDSLESREFGVEWIGCANEVGDAPVAQQDETRFDDRSITFRHLSSLLNPSSMQPTPRTDMLASKRDSASSSLPLASESSPQSMGLQAASRSACPSCTS